MSFYMKFKIGDRVTIKGDDYQMVVLEVDRETGLLTCDWLDGETMTVSTRKFRPEQLQLAEFLR